MRGRADVHFVLHRVLIGGSIAFIAQYACVVIVTLVRVTMSA